MKTLVMGLATLGMLAGYAMATIEVTTPHFENGCYQIVTAGELFGFADLVNNHGKTKACAQLTADIADASDSKTVAWTPMMDYSGYFEGNGHTITGLYYSNTSGGQIGLFGALQSGAIVKNVKLADVDISAGSVVGGLVGIVSGTDIIIDGCGVSGSVDGSLEVGGLVGNISDDAEVTIANSYNAATVGTGSQGEDRNSLIGFVYNDVKLNLFNCYNLLNTDNNIVGLRYLFGSFGNSTININSLECNSNGKYKCAYYSISSGQASDEGVTALDDGDKLDSIFNANASSSDYQSTYVTPVYTASPYAAGKLHALNINTLNLKGVSIASTEDGVTATIADDATTFYIPQDIAVDTVKFNRTFLNNKSATMALPFDVSDMSSLSGATFYELTGINKRASDEERDTINGSEASSIVAYKPYVIAPAAAGKSLLVSGAVTLKSTSAATLTNTFTTDWNFITAVSQKRWDAVGSTGYPEGNNVAEIGRVYGFAGSNPSGIAYGNFVRAVTNVAVNPLRAYLKYTGTLPENCSSALCKPSAELEPSETIVFRIVEPVIASEEKNQDTTETQDSTAVEPTDSFQKVTPVTGAAKADRWFDMKGRALNKKPTTKGTYINNHSVVIIK